MIPPLYDEKTDLSASTKTERGYLSRADFMAEMLFAGLTFLFDEALTPVVLPLEYAHL